MWIDGLAGWYAAHGRHQLPWRHTRDPWAVLVSEVMLQQTSVARVLPRWATFLERWPDPAGCAAAPLADVLRFWDGLGYPRRARDLHAAAGLIAAAGWPAGEAGLRGLPGVGAYTARALRVLVDDDPTTPPPRDVNLGRVAARAAAGVELGQARPAELDAALARSRRGWASPRSHAYALFDLGATVCVARRPRCAGCPLHRCASRERLTAAAPPAAPPRQAAYAGSARQLRGAVLRAMLAADPPATVAELCVRLGRLPAAADPDRVAGALAGLRAEGPSHPVPRGVTRTTTVTLRPIASSSGGVPWHGTPSR